GRVKLKDLAVFCRQFATMVNSGLPILRALAILADQTASKELAKVLVLVRMDVEQGASFSGALQKHPKAEAVRRGRRVERRPGAHPEAPGVDVPAERRPRLEPGEHHVDRGAAGHE
ncbi:MAG: type II secretion system F family protein, partial [Solirubrobacterales bacterium]